MNAELTRGQQVAYQQFASETAPYTHGPQQALRYLASNCWSRRAALTHRSETVRTDAEKEIVTEALFHFRNPGQREEFPETFGSASPKNLVLDQLRDTAALAQYQREEDIPEPLRARIELRYDVLFQTAQNDLLDVFSIANRMLERLVLEISPNPSSLPRQ